MSGTDWYETYKGKKIDILNFTEDMIDLEDISHALSMQCRYNGHSSKFYSVAEHSVHVAHSVHNFVRRRKEKPSLEFLNLFTLSALLHDASEAYLADVPRPIKPLLTNYYQIESEIEKVIADKFQIADLWPWDALIKNVDSRILLDERAALMSDSGNDWNLGDLEPLGVKIECWSPEEARFNFEVWAYRCMSGAKDRYV